MPALRLVAEAIKIADQVSAFPAPADLAADGASLAPLKRGGSIVQVDDADLEISADKAVTIGAAHPLYLYGVSAKNDGTDDKFVQLAALTGAGGIALAANVGVVLAFDTRWLLYKRLVAGGAGANAADLSDVTAKVTLQLTPIDRR